MKMITRAALPLLGLCATLLAVPALCADAPPAPSQSAYVKPEMHHRPYGLIKLVVPLTSDDKAIHAMKLRNIANALNSAQEWQGKLVVTVVLYAKGLSLLQNPDATTKQQLDRLQERGVHFAVCNNSLVEKGIDFHTLYGVAGADIVPSGFAEVAYLQARDHYVVDPVN